MIEQANERKIIVIKAGSVVYFQGGEYKLFNQKDAVTPTFVDEKLAVPTECVQVMGLNLTTDDGTATVSYNQKKTAVKLISCGDANYIPVRDVFENLGFNVLWNDNGSVVIYEKELGFDKDVTERYAGKLN